MTAINQNKEEIYNTEDRKLLISLLGEYSSKLSDICEKIDTYQRNKIFYLTLGMGTLFPLAVLLVIFVTNRFNDLINHIWSSTTIAIFVVIVIIVGMFFSNSEFLYSTRKLRLLEQEAKKMAANLQDVIRLASQLEEHVLNDIISRIELRLRLTDAESALKYHNNKVENKKMF
jgi:hypothetical protein